MKGFPYKFIHREKVFSYTCICLSLIWIDERDTKDYFLKSDMEFTKVGR